MLYKYGTQTREFLGRSYFYVSFVCYILGAFLIKNNYPTCACEIWDDYSPLGTTRLVGYLPSHIQRALVEWLSNSLANTVLLIKNNYYLD